MDSVAHKSPTHEKFGELFMSYSSHLRTKSGLRCCSNFTKCTTCCHILTVLFFSSGEKLILDRINLDTRVT